VALQEDHGVTVHRTSSDILAAQLAAWDILIADLGQDPFMQRIMDSQRAFVERVVYFQLMGAADLTLAYNHYFPGKLSM
jgi:hypothetical protein